MVDCCTTYSMFTRLSPASAQNKSFFLRSSMKVQTLKVLRWTHVVYYPSEQTNSAQNHHSSFLKLIQSKTPKLCLIGENISIFFPMRGNQQQNVLKCLLFKQLKFYTFTLIKFKRKWNTTYDWLGFIILPTECLMKVMFQTKNGHSTHLDDFGGSADTF